MSIITNPNISGVIGVTSQTDVYAQPDATGVWAGRPIALSVPVPSWAKKLTVGICSSGGGGGSGRRGATLTARAGGGAGAAGVPFVWIFPLLDSAGAQIATSVTLTVGAAAAGGAAQTVDDTNGNAAGANAASSLVFAGVTYTTLTTGTPAAGGTNASGGSSGNTPGQFPSSSSAATNVTTSLGTGYPSGPLSPGGPGGSISTADAILNPGTISLASAGMPSSIGVNTTSGAAGAGQRNGLIFGARGGNGGDASIIAAAQAGGNGIYGAGGGGGGASANTFASGAGGMSGHGWAVLFWE